MYDPTVGVWLQRDQVEEGPNLHQYVEGNPANMVDPFGLQAATAPASGPTSQPAPFPAPPGNLATPEQNGRYLVGDVQTQADLRSGNRPYGKWTLAFQGRGQKTNATDYNLMAAWQLFIYDVDWSKLGKAGKLELRQYVRRRDWGNAGWGNWGQWGPDMTRGTLARGSAGYNEREGFSGMFQTPELGPGTSAYLDPGSSGGIWQPNRMVYAVPKAYHFEKQNTIYDATSWWDGPNYSVHPANANETWAQGNGVDWWFYVEVWVDCGKGERRRIDSAQFAVGLQVRSTGKQAKPAQQGKPAQYPIESQLYVRDIAWLGNP